MKMKVLWDGEFSKVTNLQNKNFNANSPCKKCGSFKVEPVWYSIKTKDVYCLKCFTPKQYRG